MNAQPASETEPLLASRLFIPRVRAALVARPRLVSQLDGVLEAKLALLCAQGGFGKTTLLSQWARSLSSHLPIGWLTLTGAENDPATFWSYMAAAVDRVEPGLGRALQGRLQTAAPGAFESLWMAFLHGVSQAADQFVLVLDDYHLITEPAIHRAMGHLIEQMPPQMHLVISGRTDPPLPLARLRAAGDLVELRAEELRFAPTEVAALLVEVKGLGLQPAQLDALAQRTEGWVAGLQMAALSMQGRTDLDGFVASFTGSHRFVVDYLGEEVLERQPEAVRSFLLQTAILERLSGPLCDAVTGGSDGREMLQQLEQANLFLAQLDEHRTWYRYHALFAEMLRSRLAEQAADLVPELHQRASAWYAAQGELKEAVQHALAAGALALAADLITQGLALITRRGEWQTLLTWLDALPIDLISQRPALAIAYGQRLVEAGQMEAAEQILQAVAQAPELGPSLRGQVAAVRSYARRIQFDLPGAIGLGREALALLPEDEAGWRGMVALRLAGAYHQRGDLEQAAVSYAEAAILSRRAGDIYTAVISLCAQARLQMHRGHGHEALALYQQAVRVCHDQGDEALTATCTAHVSLALILWRRYEREGAEHHATEALRFAERAGHREALLYAHLLLAILAQLKGEGERAQQHVDQAERLVPAEVPWVSRLVKRWRAERALLAGNLKEAVEWAEIHADLISDELFSPLVSEISLLLWVQSLSGQSAAMLERVGRLLPLAEQAPELSLVQEFRLYGALAYQQQGKSAQALAELEAALGLAESTGVIAPFVLLGPPVARLLRQALPQSGRRELIGRLLAALGAESGEPHQGGLLEPLTERELEVLRLLADGASNQEIGGRLFIALATVKKHLANIFGKLGVANRVQALKRAQELGLI